MIVLSFPHLIQFGPSNSENQPGKNRRRKTGLEINNSAADCQIALKFGTMAHCESAEASLLKP